MTQIEFESFLGKDIAEISFYGDYPIEKNKSVITPHPEVQFFKKLINHIGIILNDAKMIKGVVLYMGELDEEPLIKLICNNYGDDYNVMIRELLYEKSSTSESEGEFKEILTTKQYTIKKGSLEDANRDHIVWNKDDFRIMLYTRNSSNIDLHFTTK